VRSDGTFAGLYSLYLVVDNGGSVTLNAYSLNVNAEDGFGRLNAKSDVTEVIYFSDTVATVLESTNDFLVVGCADCQSDNGGNYGWLEILEPSSLNKLRSI